MSPRFAPVAAATLLLLAVAACSGTAAVAPSLPGSPASDAPVSHAPIPTPVLVPTATPAPTDPATDPTDEPVVDPTEQPNTGDVDGSAGKPELTIEDVDANTVQATLDDPAAKAWRLVVAGTGARGGDRWEIRVETGDIGPVITATEVVDGKVVDEMDLSGFWDGTAAAGGCHSTLGVCLESSGFTIPDGDGRFSVRLDLPEGQVPLVIRGGTARWDGEPFVLGPWRDTEAFPWGEG